MPAYDIVVYFATETEGKSRCLVLLHTVTAIDEFIIAYLGIFGIIELEVVITLILIDITVYAGVVQVVRTVSDLLPVAVGTGIIIRTVVSQIAPFSDRVMNMVMMEPEIFQPIGRPSPLGVIGRGVCLDHESGKIRLVDLDTKEFKLVRIVGDLYGDIRKFRHGNHSEPLI